MRPSGLGFAGVSSAEPEALVSFLALLLGAEPERAGEGTWMLALPDGDSIAVVDRPHGGSSSDTILGFVVDDLDAVTAALAARGVEPRGAGAERHGLRWRKFPAPDGRVVELVERR